MTGDGATLVVSTFKNTCQLSKRKAEIGMPTVMSFKLTKRTLQKISTMDRSLRNCSSTVSCDPGTVGKPYNYYLRCSIGRGAKTASLSCNHHTLNEWFYSPKLETHGLQITHRVDAAEKDDHVRFQFHGIRPSRNVLPSELYDVFP